MKKPRNYVFLLLLNSTRFYNTITYCVNAISETSSSNQCKYSSSHRSVHTILITTLLSEYYGQLSQWLIDKQQGFSFWKIRQVNIFINTQTTILFRNIANTKKWKYRNIDVISISWRVFFIHSLHHPQSLCLYYNRFL